MCSPRHGSDEAMGVSVAAPGGHSSVSIVIVNWNTRDLLADAISSVIANAESFASNIVVVDNASHDDSVAMVRRAFPGVEVISSDTNLGFGAANNRGVATSNKPYFLFLNSDAELLSGTLPILVEALDEHPEAAAVGARLVHPDGRFQASFADFPRLWDEIGMLFALPRPLRRAGFPSYSESASQTACEADWVGAACVMVRRTAYEGIGGFDPSFHMYSEELDLCRRLRSAGWTIRYSPDAVARHHGGQSTTQRAGEQPALLWGSRLRYHRRYGSAGRATVLTLLVAIAYALRAGFWAARAIVARAERRDGYARRAKSAARAARCDGARLAAVPNGFDPALLDVPRSRCAGATLVYSGAPTYGPNRDAVLWFGREVLPRVRATHPTATLAVTGALDGVDLRPFTPLDGVDLTGYIADLPRFLANRAASVIPLLGGAGTRIKALEAMALAMPVVSTSKGIEGLDISDEEHCLVADSAEAMAAAVCRVLDDPDRCEAMGRRARDHVATRYGWDRIGARFVDLVEEAYEAAGRHSSGVRRG